MHFCFGLSVWRVMLTKFLMFKQLCIPAKNSSWLWHIIFFSYCWIVLNIILLSGGQLHPWQLPSCSRNALPSTRPHAQSWNLFPPGRCRSHFMQPPPLWKARGRAWQPRVVLESILTAPIISWQPTQATWKQITRSKAEKHHTHCMPTAGASAQDIELLHTRGHLLHKFIIWIGN